MNFGETLKNLRKKYDLSMEELADEIGFGSSTISQYERGLREPNFERLRIIKEYFGVDYNFLLEDKEDDKEVIKQIELDIVDLKSVLRKNYVTVEGRKMSEEAKQGLIMFLENY